NSGIRLDDRRAGHHAGGERPDRSPDSSLGGRRVAARLERHSESMGVLSRRAHAGVARRADVPVHQRSVRDGHAGSEERMRNMADKINIATCLWFNKNAEEAARFYAATFPDSRVIAVHKAPSDYPSGKAGDVLTVDFTVLGQRFMGLNGGPEFTFDEAIS